MLTASGRILDYEGLVLPRCTRDLFLFDQVYGVQCLDLGDMAIGIYWRA
jgi:hypothetical protein